MGTELKKTANNGTYNEFEGVRQRGPDPRNKWEIFKDGIYNATENTILGRTKKQWGIFSIFYLIFYSGLACLCAICFMGLKATLDEHKPTYTLDSSLIGTNPGLGFRPLPDDIEKGAIIRYVSSNSSHIGTWTTRIDEFLERYLDKSKLPGRGRNQMICNYTRPVLPGKVCAVDVTNLSQCTKSHDYGYSHSAPCVFIKLNKIFDWKPDFYDDPKDLPANMPDDLKDRIKEIGETKRNTIWVSCNGEREEDKKNIGQIRYYPEQGFPGYYYPYENSPDYLSPVVAVHFLRPKRNVSIHIECRAWAKNIRYSSRRGEKAGAVHFELMIME